MTYTAKLLIILALLLAGCTVPPSASKGTANPVYGPTWPRGTCDAVATCWPIDGARGR